MQDKTERNKDRYRALWIAKRFWQIANDLLHPEDMYGSAHRNTNPTGKGVLVYRKVTTYYCPRCKETKSESKNGACYKCFQKGEKDFLYTVKTKNKHQIDPTLYPALPVVEKPEILAYSIRIPNETREDWNGKEAFQLEDNLIYSLYPENYHAMCEAMLIDGVSDLMQKYEQGRSYGMYVWNKRDGTYQKSHAQIRNNMEPLCEWIIENFDYYRTLSLPKYSVEYDEVSQ